MNTARVIYYILSNHTGTTDLVESRIYPIAAAQLDVFPYITFQLISLAPVTSTCEGLDQARYQIEIYARTQDEASDIKDEVRDAMSSATLGTMDGINVSFIRLDTFSESDYDITDRVHSYRLEYLINLSS